jgi:hypothetical protein
MSSSAMFRGVALVRTDVSEELITSFIRVARIGELGTTLAATRNRRKLRRNFLQEAHASTACYGDSFTFLFVDDVRTSQETGSVMGTALLICN